MSNTAYDESLYSHSMMDGEGFQPNFVDRQTIEIPDSNGTSYGSGNVVFDMQSLATGSSFVDFRGGQVVMPLQLTTTANAGGFTAARENMFAHCLKNSVYSLIDSLIFNLNGVDVISSQSRMHMYNTYRLLSEWSVGDEQQQGPLYGFAKDSVESLTYSDVLGEINNSLVGVDHSTKSVQVVAGGDKIMNKGRYKRARWMACTNEQVYDQFQSLTNTTNAYSSSTNTAGTAAITTQLFIVIPLKGLHPLFEQLPLMRNVHAKLTLAVHAPASFTVTTDANGVYSAPASNCPREFCPFQITSGGAAGTGLILNNCTGFTTSLVVGNATSRQCVFRVNRYTMSSESETRFLSKPVRKIVYDDVFSHVQRDVTASINNLQVGTSLSRVRRLLIVPQVSASSNGTTTFSPLLSAMSSAGSTAAPYFKCNGFNVALNGRSIYSSPLAYGYQQWCSEQDNTGGLAGGFNSGLRSGLISEAEWKSLYNVYDVNLSRHSEIDDDSPSNVTVSLTPLYKKSVDLFFYLVYSRSFSVNTSTGELSV